MREHQIGELILARTETHPLTGEIDLPIINVERIIDYHTNAALGWLASTHPAQRPPLPPSCILPFD